MLKAIISRAAFDSNWPAWHDGSEENRIAMQINLPDDAIPVIRQKAAAAGFPDQIEAYVAHLIAADRVEDYGAPSELSLAGKSREEVEAIITAGFESGPATPMTDADWQQLHARVDERNS